MNKKDFKKQFINEFKQENTPTTSFNDVFKEHPKEENIYYKKYLSLNRKFKLSIAFSCIMLLVLIVGLSISIVYVKDHNEVNNVLALSQNEIEYISKYSDSIDTFPIAMIKIVENQYLILFRGHVLDSNELYCYFFKVINFSREFSIQVGNNIVFVSHNNSLQMLVNNYENDYLYLKIMYDNFEKYYKI